MTARMRPIDWPRIVRDLERARMTSRRIGDIVGTSHAAVLGWKNLDKEPGHYTGERVITLWCAVTGKDRSEAHLESPVSKDPGKFEDHAEPEVTTCDSSQFGDEGEAASAHAA